MSEKELSSAAEKNEISGTTENSADSHTKSTKPAAATKDKSKSAASSTPAPNKTAKSGSLLSRLPLTSLIVLAVVLAGVYHLNNKINLQAYDVETALTKLTQAQKSEAETAAQKLELQQQALRQANAELANLQSQLSTVQAKGAQERLDLEAKIKQVQTEAAAKGKDPLRWRVAEVDYLMSIANQRLQLTNDVDTARTALLDADKRLRQIADPGLNAVRMALADEIKALDSVQKPDIAGMANQLTTLVSGIEGLPLTNRDHKRQALRADMEKDVASWRELPGMLWAEIRGLITIRRHDQPIEPLLPPAEKHYLAQNLALKLEQARLALLRQDNAVFHANIADTESWVQRYFDNQESSVQAVLKTLEELKNANLRPDLPDISKSLRELRAWRQARSES